MTLHEEIHAQLAKMEGWCSPEKAFALADTVIREKALHCVEVGVFGGKSFLAIAYGLRELKQGIVHGIDTWKADDSLVDSDDKGNADWWAKVDLEKIYEGFMRARMQSGLAPFTQVWHMSSRDASVQINTQIDLLHIDGNHSEWSSTSDVCLWLPKVRSGGIVVMDDVDWRSTQTAVRFVGKFCEQLSTAKTSESTFSVFRKR